MRHIVAAFGLMAGLLFLAAQTFTPGTPVHTHNSAAQGGSTLTSPTISAPVFSGTATGTYTLGGTPTIPTITGPTTLSGTQTFSGTVDSTKACATGFTRVLPNYCRRDNLSSEGWLEATACTTRTFSATLPADAKYAYVALEWIALSNNATGNRTNSSTFYSTSACAAGTDVAISEFAVFEQAATIAGTSIGLVTDHILIPLVSTNTFYTTQANAGSNGNADVNNLFLEGYFD